MGSKAHKHMGNEEGEQLSHGTGGSSCILLSAAEAATQHVQHPVAVLSIERSTSQSVLHMFAQGRAWKADAPALTRAFVRMARICRESTRLSGKGKMQPGLMSSYLLH